MKKKINISISEQILESCDLLAKSRGLNRSEYLSYLIMKAGEQEADMKKFLLDYFKK